MSILAVPATKRHFFPVPNAVDAFTRTYWSLLSRSDFNCLLSLVKTGRIEVVVDTDTRSVVLIPDKTCEKFVDNVFAAMYESA